MDLYLYVLLFLVLFYILKNCIYTNHVINQSATQLVQFDVSTASAVRILRIYMHQKNRRKNHVNSVGSFLWPVSKHYWQILHKLLQRDTSISVELSSFKRQRRDQRRTVLQLNGSSNCHYNSTTLHQQIHLNSLSQHGTANRWRNYRFVLLVHFSALTL